MKPDIIIDPPKGAVTVVPGERRYRRIPDRELRAALLSVKRDRKALRHQRYVYDKRGEPLGIVTFEPCVFDPFTGRRKR